MSSLPDAMHIENIRRQLWSGREFGHAAVMVGAGFSKNAELVSRSVGSFPSWDELALEIDRCLYTGNDPIEKRRHRINSIGSTRLAGEYAVTFSRASLDDLIARVIPDTQYAPGDLHRQLLSLPWSDIFTTNYDTLLERAQRGVFERKYEIVVTPADIVGRLKPRIVKLHGSLPSHRPFIITAEDFREYPTRFAPFVNMVQQSIMENALCLVGFSGNDPNFLSWIGWVRDNLGDATPPIYLCGMLKLSPPERRYLEQVLRITPIDLSPLFNTYPAVDRHAAALEWFLACLGNGAPLNLMEWPRLTRQPVRHSRRSLPPLIDSPHPLAELGATGPRRDQSSQEQILALLTRWQRTRRDYLGWIITPARNRALLWRYTESWLAEILDGYQTLPTPFDLEILYELNWRLERVMLPLFDNVVEAIASVVRRYNPYPALISQHNADVSPSVTKYDSLLWQELGEHWVALVFGLIRAAREKHDDEAFESWMRLIQPIASLSVNWQAQLHYEKSLSCLAHLDIRGLQDELGRWNVRGAAPLWDVKRAALLAELGDLDTAEKICTESLMTIRARIDPFLADYALLSSEGWTMKLLQMLAQNAFRSEQQYEGEYTDRWSRLDAYRANPGPEIDQLVSKLAGLPPQREPQYRVETNRRTGRIQMKHHFSSDLTFANTGTKVSDSIPAFAFLRMFEEAGIPMRCGNVTFHSDSVCGAAEWIFPVSPFAATVALIRSCKEEELCSRFSTAATAMLPQSFVDRLAGVLIPALSSVVATYANIQSVGGSNNGLAGRLLQTLPVLLGQLSFRLSESQHEVLFDLCLRLYQIATVRQNLSFTKALEQLFHQVLNSMSASRVTEHLSMLVSLPIPGQSGFDASFVAWWPEVIWDMDTLDGYNIPDATDRSTWKEPIDHLLQTAKSRDPEVRRRALLRLAKLHDIGVLSVIEAASFGDALWSQVDLELGLPSHTSFLNFAFLALPAPEGVNVQEKVRKFLLSAEIVRTVQYSVDQEGRTQKTIGLGKPDQYLQELHGATVAITGQDSTNRLIWNQQEAELLLHKIAHWWDDEKRELKWAKELDFAGDTVRRRLRAIVPIVAEVIVPHLVGCVTEVDKVLERLITEMEADGFATLPLQCSLMLLRPEIAPTVEQQVRLELNSIDIDRIEAATRSIVYWLIVHGRSMSVPPPWDLLDELIYRLRLRRQPGLKAVITHLKTIVDITPQVLSSEHLDGLYEALEYLLAETTLPSELLQKPDPESNVPVPLDERPEYRVLAAELAYSLFRASADLATKSSVLALWQDACHSDILPEVQRAWPTPIAG